MRYWAFMLGGLALAGAAIVGVDWGVYHLARTGTCASGGPYVSARPCPPGTGLHIVALVLGIFAGLAGVALFAARGQGGRPARIGLGAVTWSLLFVTLAGSVAVAAYGPASNHSGGARTAAIVLGVIFVPMGLAPLALLLRSRARGDGGFQPIVSSPPAVVSRPPVVAPPPSADERLPDRDDPLGEIARLGALRDRGLVTDEEFEQQKRRLLGEL